MSNSIINVVIIKDREPNVIESDQHNEREREKREKA
jgi:hypothetical protein